MPLVKATAIVLKSLKWGDADRIVTCYSKERGKLRGVARGARRLKSRFGAALEPFSLCQLNLFEKTGDSLYRISHVDLVRSSQKLRESLGLIDSAARMVNVVAAITPDGDPDPLLFETLVQGLASLHESEDPTFMALLFQIRLLGVTGFRPQTDQCATCGKTHFMGDPQFSPVAGGLVCLPCAAHQRVRCVALSRGSLSFLQQAIRLDPTIVTRLRASGQVRGEVEAAIEGYVTVVAGKRLPSANFLSVAGS
ncbi:MAG: DNA repair protein RecO [Nitrospira sp.]|nr:DNA repair protein RecO [Nitrospira sp.]MDH4303401.1 DNA repair protein RecO [Nitrospira sp.]MDH5193136.1 DNA repair protein RecO [Nitrospira sp.]